MSLFKEHQALIADQQVEYESLLPLRYNFQFQKIKFECLVERNNSNDNIVMNLTANLGILPYSSENIARRMELLSGLGPLIARGQVSIDHHCSISMSLKTILKKQFDAKGLIEAIVYTLLDVRGVISHVSNFIDAPKINNSLKKRA